MTSQESGYQNNTALCLPVPKAGSKGRPDPGKSNYLYPNYDHGLFIQITILSIHFSKN
jgi:hypothetical protein